jgi:NADH dehydrogenase FAD-containing subunit
MGPWSGTGLLADVLRCARRSSGLPAVLLVGSAGFGLAAASAAEHSDEISRAKVHRTYTHVICGAGPAGREALQVLQANANPADSILLIAPAVKSGTDQWSRNSWQEDANFHIFDQDARTDIVLGDRVVAVDPVLKTAALHSGDEVSFQKLLLAVGGDIFSKDLKSVVAAEAEPRVGFIQSATCSERLDALLAQGEDPRRTAPHVTVVGGSWGAACLGASLVEKGAEVALSYAEPALLARHFPRYVSDELARRFKWASNGNFDFLSYSVLNYITNEETPIERRQDVAIAEQEACVHSSLIFDPYSTTEFRTDFVVFAPTMLPAPQLVHSIARDNGGRFVANPELAVYTDIYVAGSCLAAVPTDGALNLEYWSTERAAATGRHAAWNMLGRRSPFEAGPSRYAVSLDPIHLRLYCVGIPDGSLETYGLFKRSQDRGEETCGGELEFGVLCYVRPVPRQPEHVQVVGLVVWDGHGALTTSEERVSALADTFFAGRLHEKRQGLEAALQELLREAVKVPVRASDSNDIENDICSDRRRFVRRHTQARGVPIREEEILWFDGARTASDGSSVPRNQRAAAFDALLRRKSRA